MYVADNPGACNKNPCVLYPKSAQLPSGRIVAAFENDQTAPVGQTMPVYKSDDEGTTWQKLADVKAPAYLSSDAKYAKYTSNWTNPYLYVLPQNVGNLSAADTASRERGLGGRLLLRGAEGRQFQLDAVQ